MGQPIQPKVGLSAYGRNFAPIERIHQNWGVSNAPKLGGIGNEYRIVPVEVPSILRAAKIKIDCNFNLKSETLLKFFGLLR